MLQIYNRYILSVLSVFALLAAGYAQSTEPVLRINGEMHNANIFRCDTDREGRFVLTVSIDKTVKLWSSSTGELLRTYRPPIGDGDEGMLYAGAISPDGNVIAVGGYTGSNGDYSIYIFDRSSGVLIHRIKQLPRVIDDLEFSPDGRTLAACVSRGGVYFYDASSYTLVSKDEDCDDRSYNLAFSPDGQYSATVAYDGKLRLYNQQFELINTKQLEYAKPYSLAFSEDGQKIAVGYDDHWQIQVFNLRNLSLAYEPDMSGAEST
ncbi:MAG: peptidase C14, partial [Bacteroidota bacterium]